MFLHLSVILFRGEQVTSHTRMLFCSTFYLSAKRSSHLNVGFKDSGVATSHLSVILTLPDISHDKEILLTIVMRQYRQIDAREDYF